jgi:hypothetical protein
MNLRIYNRTGADGTFKGQFIASDAYYDVPATSMSDWASDPVIRDLVDKGQLGIGDGVVEKVSTLGTRQLDMIVQLGPTDTDGSQLVRTKTTKTGWHFEPRALDFVTAKRASLHNKSFDGWSPGAGTDLADGVIKFYNSSGVQLVQAEGELDAAFQARLGTDCTCTIVDWEPSYNWDVNGCIFQVKSPPAGDAYLYVIAAPDIPANLGGSVCFTNGGWNLSFFSDKQLMDLMGGGVKSIAYDPVYHSGKVRLKIQHAAGVQIGIQMCYKQYKA